MDTPIKNDCHTHRQFNVWIYFNRHRKTSVNQDREFHPKRTRVSWVESRGRTERHYQPYMRSIHAHRANNSLQCWIWPLLPCCLVRWGIETRSWYICLCGRISQGLSKFSNTGVNVENNDSKASKSWFVISYCSIDPQTWPTTQCQRI
jgi:hypothetical protein